MVWGGTTATLHPIQVKNTGGVYLMSTNIPSTDGYANLSGNALGTTGLVLTTANDVCQIPVHNKDGKIMVVGIFVGMTALAFYDRDSFLGFGPYLMAGLVGLIVAHVVGIVLGLTGAVTAKTFHDMSQVFAWFGAVLFTVFIAYDTQKMKARAATGSKHPDYIEASLNLYLDVINLFSDVGRINS